MYKQFLKVCLLGVMGLGLAVGAQAQTGIYGEFTGAKISANNSKWMFGPTVGLYHDSGHGLVATGLDVRGTFVGRGNESLDTLLGGVRLAITPRVLPFKPYGEVLGGLGHLKVGNSTSNKFAYQFIGGLDDTILPRLDWRVIEFSYGRLAGLSDSYAPKTISTGLVLRLP
ncbi:MAG TPA: hypothetical protein VL346_04675 [Acidobacteriaceae bacterium]|nr:hypothetical protein [Acidobacteriaceae bacterium]